MLVLPLDIRLYMFYNFYTMTNSKNLPKNWNFPVSESLDNQAFECAHETRLSKSEFIRQAVLEKINRLKGEKNNK